MRPPEHEKGALVARRPLMFGSITPLSGPLLRSVSLPYEKKLLAFSNQPLSFGLCL